MLVSQILFLDNHLSMPAIFDSPEIGKRCKRISRRLQQVGLLSSHPFSMPQGKLPSFSVKRPWPEAKPKARLYGSQMMLIHHLFPSAFASGSPCVTTGRLTTPPCLFMLSGLSLPLRARLRRHDYPASSCIVYQNTSNFVPFQLKW